MEIELSCKENLETELSSRETEACALLRSFFSHLITEVNPGLDSVALVLLVNDGGGIAL